jgi:TrmH family RNA methyltransferase
MKSPAGPELTNPRSERVKAVRALSGRSVRLRTGRFVVEGPQSVREIVREAPGRVRDLYVTPAGADRYGEILADAAAAHLRVHVGSDEVLAAMSPDAQGLLAVAETHDPGLPAVLGAAPRLVAVLARVRDPGNAGTVIRAADAAGADAVVLTAESVDVHNPKVVRSTAGSLFHLPVTAGAPLADVTTGLRAAGLTVLAADGSGEHDLDDLLDAVGRPGDPGSGSSDAARSGVPDLTRPTAWLFGNEAWGLPEEDRALADAVVRVPIRGRAESLNLATAATVCLYASSRAQR